MLKILVVDDEPLNNKLVLAYLADQPYDVECASNAEDAFEKLQTQQFDLILLDRMMPGMDGLQFAEKLKHDTALASIPIVLQTAAADKVQLNEGLQAGIVDIITKPFDENDLIYVIKTCLDRVHNQ